jgi:hypothetical protein
MKSPFVAVKRSKSCERIVGPRPHQSQSDECLHASTTLNAIPKSATLRITEKQKIYIHYEGIGTYHHQVSELIQ